MVTKRERRAHLKEKYFEPKQKFWVMITILIVYIILFGLLGAAFNTGADISVIVLIILIIILFVPVSIFLLDSVMYEYQ